MGFDCTFHLVDETAIRQQFVPRLLERIGPETPLDRIREDAGELWKTVRSALQGDDPEEAASLVCQLAVIFSACSLPHHYERGFALSLWEGQQQEIAVDFPSEFCFSPEPLFREIVASYPQLQGRFPTCFTGNYTTGVYIPSERVPEALRWIEARVQAFPKGDRRLFKGLLTVLRAAETRGLAYWEATDLAVPMAGQVPGDAGLMTADYLRNVPGEPGQQVERAPLGGHVSILFNRVFDGWFVSADTDPWGTNFWDLSAWPPRLTHSLQVFAPYLSLSPGGDWLLCSEPDRAARPRTFRPRLCKDLNASPDLEMPLMVGGKEIGIREAGFAAGRPVVFLPYEGKAGDAMPPPLWWEGHGWVPIPGLEAGIAEPSEYKRFLKEKARGTVRLPGGGDVIVWDGNGYEFNGSRFRQTFLLNAEGHTYELSPVTTDDDSFFYLSHRHLFHVKRGGTPLPHVPRWHNIMWMGRGPFDSLLLKEGDNKDGDVAKLYFPADGTLIHIAPELFDDKAYSFICWCESADRFVVTDGNEFLALPVSAVMGLPREPVP